MTRRLVLSQLMLVLASACEAHERNWLFDGEWIDVDGWDREADEACAGSFEYLDDYSGMLAQEFDLDGPLGVFRWSSRAHYMAGDLPCDPGWTCAQAGEAYTTTLPDEHEVVHLANFRTSMCPNLLAEGLAVYYGGVRGSGSAVGDLELLSARLTQPGKPLSPPEYPIAGRFAAFLVHEFGLAAVLRVCSSTGRRPKAARFASAMESILGATPAELVEQLAAEPDECNEFSRFGARLYACGENPLAPHAGVVEPDADFAATYSLGCGQAGSIGSVDDDEVRYIRQIEIAEAGTYRFFVQYADGNDLESPPVSVVLAKCGYCGEVEEFHAHLYGYYYELEAGRYWLEFRAPPDFADAIELTINHEAGW